MEKDSIDERTPSKIDVELVSNALILLADNVEFVASGRADELMDYEAWNHRESGGQQLCCLRSLLHRGELDFARVDRATSNHLRNIWAIIKLLQYGEHHDPPDDYKGPMFLPGEVHPDGTFCRIDDLPPDLLTMIPNNVRSQLPLATKRDQWSWLPNMLRKLSSLLLGKGDDGDDFDSLSPHEKKLAYRNKRMYEMRMSGETWQTILDQLKANDKRWPKLSTASSVRTAVLSYAKKYNRPIPPDGQAGRPKK